jgi:acetate kinase
MGSRCGDIDPSILPFIMSKESIDIPTASTLINKHSGMLGITGISSDMREIYEAAYKNNHERAKLGLDMYHYRIRKYIGSYAAAMGGVDIIVFTGGIGENSIESRYEICSNFQFLGVDFDERANIGLRGKEILITKPESKVKIMVVTTNEELVIAQDTMEIVDNLKTKPRNLLW